MKDENSSSPAVNSIFYGSTMYEKSLKAPLRFTKTKCAASSVEMT